MFKFLSELSGLPNRMGLMRMKVEVRFTLAIAVEIAYMAISRYFYHAYSASFADVELARTLPRLIAALLFWLLMADVIFSRRPDLTPMKQSSFVVAVVLDLATSFLMGGYVTSAGDRLIIAAAALPVAMCEEFFFRGILQTMVIRHLGTIGGLIVTSALFTLYHVGVTLPVWENFVYIGLGGLLMGTIYIKTGSMLSIVLYHTLYDVIDGLAPFRGQFSFSWGIGTSVLATVLITLWAWRSNTTQDDRTQL